MIDDAVFASIEVAISDEDLEHVGVDPDNVDLEELIDCFEAILQEDYYYTILREALSVVGIYER